jgi:uncharacterized protein
MIGGLVKLQKILYGLIELQEVDRRLDELKEERGDLPLIVEELNKKLAEKRSQLEHDQSSLKTYKLRQRELELKINESKVRMEKYEEQLYQVKTNREYDAITLETETVKKQLDEEQAELQTLKENIQGLEAKISETEVEVEKLEGELEENNIELQVKLNETSEEENLLKQEREIIISKTSPHIVKQYEMVRRARSGQGIAKVEGNTCGGCYSFIPPQKIVEVKKMKEIFTCEFCGRILVWDESSH